MQQSQEEKPVLLKAPCPLAQPASPLAYPASSQPLPYHAPLPARNVGGRGGSDLRDYKDNQGGAWLISPLVFLPREADLPGPGAGQDGAVHLPDGHPAELHPQVPRAPPGHRAHAASQRLCPRTSLLPALCGATQRREPGEGGAAQRSSAGDSGGSAESHAPSIQPKCRAWGAIPVRRSNGREESGVSSMLCLFANVSSPVSPTTEGIK